MIFVDTHCHLDDPVLAQRLSMHLGAAAAAGVEACIVPGVAPAGWSRILSLSRENEHGSPRLYPAFGVHPMHADLLDREVLRDLEGLAPLATAIGEIGLDYALPAPAREVQREAFLQQLRLAQRHDLPVLIHCRKAFGDLLELLHAEGRPVRGVMHAFSGSIETAAECVKMGLKISLCGTLTYANAVKPVAVAERTPLEDLLLETDAPDLAPEPHRGEVNVPGNLLFTAEKLSAVKGVTLEEIARTTTETANRLFRLPR